MIDVTVGQCRRGLSQDSWWKVTEIDGDKVAALCMKAPSRYPWVEPGEVRWFPAAAFEENTEVMP